MKDHVELSIIIVNYKTKELTKLCLDSVFEHQKKEDKWEVIVVDNGSNDGTVEMLEVYKKSQKNLQSIYLSKNVGFAAGNNIGIKKASGEFILLLNSDTEVHSDAIQYALNQIKRDKKIGAFTVELLLSNGSLDPACHRGFPTPWAAVSYFLGLEKLFPQSRFFSQYHQWYKNMHIAHEVDVISGGFFLTRRKLLEELNFIDESYFMYGEDIDLAYRIKEKGLKIIFDPNKNILHKKKQSGRNNANKEIKKQTSIYFYETMKLFYKKHYAEQYPSIITNFIFFILDLRIYTIKFL